MSSEDSPNPSSLVPEFHPIDIGKTVAQALEYDTQGFDWSDTDFISRFPGLVATRNQQIDDAYNQLTGPLDPSVQSLFTRGGIQAGLGVVGGGGDPLSGLGMTKGSFGSNTASATLAKSLLEKQDYDRSNLDMLIGNNPQRAFGISGEGVANLAIANTGGLNASNQQQYQATLAGIYGQGQQNAATGAQIAALGNILARINFGGGTGAGGSGGGGYGG